MSAFVIVPTIFWKAYSSIAATENLGSIYNAMNSPKNDYASIDTATNIDFTHSAALTFPTSFASNGACFWIKCSDVILDAADPNNHYLQLWTGASAGTVAQETLVSVYGDAIANSDDVEINTGVSKSDGFANIIGVFDDQYNSVVWRIVEDSYGTGGGVSAMDIYEVMIGHAVTLPSGYIREERSIQRVHFGGRVGTSRAGEANFGGIYSKSPRRVFELQMERLPESDRNIWRDIYRYCRGVYPVLVVEDSSDKTTWTKCKMTGLNEEEIDASFTVTIGFEEI